MNFAFEDSSCLTIELTSCSNERKSSLLNDQMNLLICHLSDDDQTKQIRSTLRNRYERLMSTVNQNIQTILQEHQSKIFSSRNSSSRISIHLAIENQMAFELGIFPRDLSHSTLSYDAHQLALRTAIERLKS